MAEDSGISWHIDTHNHVVHSVDWYWGAGLLTLAAVGISIFLGNYLLAFMLLIAVGSAVVLILRGPREHEVRLTQKGLIVDGTIYPWNNIESFWVEESRIPNLLITTAGVLHPQMVIPLLDPSRARNVRDYARRYCKEEEQHPHLGHHITEMLGL